MIHSGRWPRRRALRASSGSDLRTIPDEELAVAYIVHGDQRAFGELYRRLAPFLLAIARRRTYSHDAARELVQHAFLNAHLARERFELGSNFRPWITRIVLNLAADRARAGQRWQLADVDPAELVGPATENQSDRSVDRDLARRALDALKPQYRRVIELHWLEERPFSEVAGVLGERVSTVKVRAHRAYKEMRRTLELAEG